MAYNKKADANYRKKTKAFAIKYYATDIAEGKRLQAYLDSIDITANEYLKRLVKQDLDAKGIAYPVQNQE